MDAMHIPLIDAPQARHLRAPFMGHGLIAYLQTIKALSALLEAVIDRRDLAQEWVETIRRQRGSVSAYWLSLAERDLQNARPVRAARWLRKALLLNPDSFSITVKLARCLKILKDDDGAGLLYAQAARLREKDESVRLKASHHLKKSASSLLREKDITTAIDRARLATQLCPDDSEGRELLGRLERLNTKRPAGTRSLKESAPIGAHKKWNPTAKHLTGRLEIVLDKWKQALRKRQPEMK